jgi:hypothetical protein
VIIKISPSQPIFTAMFAVYTLFKNGSNHHYLGLTPSHLIVKQRNKKRIYDLQSLRGATVDKKRKLIPLISGGIISSLSLLAMVLQMITFETIALLSGGLLLFYYGFTEYVVIHLTTDNSEVKFWLAHKHSLKQVRPFVGIIEFFARHKRFPPLYLHVPYHAIARHIHNQQNPVTSAVRLSYQLFANTSPSIAAIVIDPIKLDAPIHFASADDHLAWGDHLVNHAAVIEVIQASAS